MTAPDFITAGQAARAREAEAEAKIEQIKRALEAAIADYGFSQQGPIGRYCASIGLEVRISKGAGVEFDVAPALKLAKAIELAPVPELLRRYLRDET